MTVFSSVDGVEGVLGVVIIEVLSGDEFMGGSSRAVALMQHH